MSNGGFYISENAVPLAFDCVALIVSFPLLFLVPKAKWEKDGKPDKHSTRLLFAALLLFFLAMIFDTADYGIGLHENLHPESLVSPKAIMAIVVLDALFSYASHACLGWLIVRTADKFLKDRIRNSSDDERIKYRRYVMAGSYTTYTLFFLLQIVSFGGQIAIEHYIETENYPQYEKLYIPAISISLTLAVVYTIFVFLNTLCVMPILTPLRAAGYGATVFSFLALLASISLVNIMGVIDDADNISVWDSEQRNYDISPALLNSDYVVYAITAGLSSFFSSTMFVAVTFMALRPPYGDVLSRDDESNKRGWSSEEGYYSQSERLHSDAKATPQELDAHDAPAELTTETPIRELEGDTNGEAPVDKRARGARGSANHPAFRHGESDRHPEAQPLAQSGRPNPSQSQGSFANLKDAFRRAAGLRKPAWNRESQNVDHQID